MTTPPAEIVAALVGLGLLATRLHVGLYGAEGADLSFGVQEHVAHRPAVVGGVHGVHGGARLGRLRHPHRW